MASPQEESPPPQPAPSPHPDPELQNSTTQADQLQHFLSRFQLQSDTAPYVHPKVISYNDAAQKRLWTRPDNHLRDTATKFYKAKNANPASIALFHVPKGSTVGVKNHHDIPWRCFAAALIRDPVKGSHLVIYDPNPSANAAKPNPRAAQVLSGVQRAFFNWIRRGRDKNIRLWYSLPNSTAPQGESFQWSADKIKEWASLPSVPYQGKHDLRMAGCIHISKC